MKRAGRYTGKPDPLGKANFIYPPGPVIYKRVEINIDDDPTTYREPPDLYINCWKGQLLGDRDDEDYPIEYVVEWTIWEGAPFTATNGAGAGVMEFL